MYIPNLKCPYCNCPTLVKAGQTHLKHRFKQQYKCQTCHSHTVNPATTKGEDLFWKEYLFLLTGNEEGLNAYKLKTAKTKKLLLE